MNKRLKIAGLVLLVLSIGTTSFADIAPYLNEQEYNDVLRDNYSEDRGIVIENNPSLGYITYRNAKGRTVTRNYYTGEVTVEKQPYYETEDKIGYIDELFPYFKYDPRDTSISSILPGDCIYIRTNSSGDMTYISASNDYIMRYGKVVSFVFNTGEMATLSLEDERGNLYSYSVALNTPVTKGGAPYSISSIAPGSWVKVLVSQKILGAGIVEESVEEVVIDNDTRVISNIYRGQVTSINAYKNTLNLKNAQALGNLKWGVYSNVLSLSVNPNNLEAYLIGNPVSVDYINRQLKSASGYVYVAAERYKGKETAVKLNFQSKLQNTLSPSTVTYASAGMIKLLSGETLYVAEDAIIVRDNRLVESHNIMVGDVLQAVVTGENKLAVGNISSDLTTGSIEVFRGRIKKVETREEFQVETFSLLEDNTWYYHPTPRTFTIDNETKFYTDSGIEAGGIEEFLGHGEETVIGNVYTVVAIGEKAYMIVDMPYVTESVKGEVYEVTGDEIKIKDAYYYHRTQKKWLQYSKKNVGATIELSDNSVIIKNGKVIPARQLEEGDRISAMVETNLKDAVGTVPGYIIVVEE